VLAHLRAGIAVYNDGDYHAAHDAWEDRWLDLEDGTDDERFLHGLIQFTAAVHHAHDGNWDGATNLAESAIGYLDGLDDTYRRVDLASVRAFLADLAEDPELVERGPVLALTYDGDALTYADLDVEATIVAAEVVAEEYGYDVGPIDRAGHFARQDMGVGYGESTFVALLFDFVREPEDRAVIYQRLVSKANERTRREDDVEGLFE
jgi:hypothetical protein